MKILLISPLPPPAGGIASWTASYLASLQAKMQEIRVINTSLIGSRTRNLNKRNFKDEVVRNITIIKKVIKELHNDKPDIVHLNISCSSLGLIREFVCARLVKRKKIKLVVHCHCDVSYMLQGHVAKLFFGKLIGLSDRVITLNNVSKEFIYYLYKINSIIIPNFLSDDLMNKIDAGNSDGGNGKTCIFVGHIGKAKGCDIIIEMAHLLPDYRFIMVGPLSEEIRRMKQPSNVVYVGEVSQEEVIRYMQNSDIFILPTLSEGFPVAILEAMACGLPIVTTPVGAIPDMIEEQGGVMVEIGKTSGFTSAIKTIVTSHSIYKAMSEWNTEKVKNYYAENIVLDELFNEYTKIVNSIA